MKRLTALFLLIVLALSMSACRSGASGVPVQLIEDDIGAEFDLSEISYSFEHNMDNKTQIDTVTVEVVETETYCKQYYTGICTYQYDRVRDIWYCYDTPEWEWDRTEYLPHMYKGVWEGEFEKQGGAYYLDIENVNFDNGTITGYFSAYVTETRMGGGRITYELEASGTYDIYEEYSGYRLEIMQDRATFVFELHPYWGARGVAVKS